MTCNFSQYFIQDLSPVHTSHKSEANFCDATINTRCFPHCDARKFASHSLSCEVGTGLKSSAKNKNGSSPDHNSAIYISFFFQKYLLLLKIYTFPYLYVLICDQTGEESV